ncbi:MAG: hypothetical protein ACE5G2_11740 [Candidatus Krumholzibacteriia bacterium]
MNGLRPSRLRHLRLLHPEKRTRHWLLESVILSAILAVVGPLLSPSDPTFSRFSPTPYLVPPLILGAQYGVAAGLTGAVTALIAHCVAVALGGMLEGGHLAAAGAFLPGIGNVIAAASGLSKSFVVGLLLAGAVIGEMRDAIEQELARVRETSRRLNNRLEQLSREHLLLKETKSSLEQRLAEVADSRSTIFDEAARLYTMDRDGAYAGILRMLHTYAAVEEAALYVLENSVLRRAAQFGNEDHRPERIELGNLPIARAAVEARATVTTLDLTKEQVGPEVSGGALVAAPLIAHTNDGDASREDATAPLLGVIVVDAVPFIRLTEATVRLISLIADWGARVLFEIQEIGEIERRGLFDPVLGAYRAPYLQEKLADELRRSRRFQLDVGLLAVAPENDGSSPEQREGLGALLVAAARESCRPGDVLGVTDRDGPHAVLILPMADRQDTERRLRLIESLWAGRIREHLGGENLPPLRSCMVTSKGESDPARIWRGVESWVVAHV